jgi:hypothetical protein
MVHHRRAYDARYWAVPDRNHAIGMAGYFAGAGWLSDARLVSL